MKNQLCIAINNALSNKTFTFFSIFINVPQHIFVKHSIILQFGWITCPHYTLHKLLLIATQRTNLPSSIHPRRPKTSKQVSFIILPMPCPTKHRIDRNIVLIGTLHQRPNCVHTTHSSHYQLSLSTRENTCHHNHHHHLIPPIRWSSLSSILDACFT